MNIEGHEYTGFIDYDRVALKKASVNVWTEWLHFRLRNVLIGPLDKVFPPDSPYHTQLTQGSQTFSLCGVTLVACAIEALGGLLLGQQLASGGSFKAWLKQYMPEWYAMTPLRVKISDWLWDDARNGLAHQLAFKSGGTESNGQRFVEAKDGQIQMDPFMFYSDFKIGVGRFFEDIEKNKKVRSGFEVRFQETFLK